MIVDDHVINCMTIRETTVQRSAEITGPRRSASFMFAAHSGMKDAPRLAARLTLAGHYRDE